MKFSESEVVETLEKLYEHASCELQFENHYQLLVSVMLSAQCTDKRVNQVTPPLFAAYPSFYYLAKAKQEDIEAYIHSCGFFRSKARNIIQACREITEKHNGELPGSLEQLTALSGVGRKTANVILANAHHIPAIAVDTHVFRVSNRLGIAQAKNPHQCEKQLQAFFQRDDWSYVHHALVLFGRYVCIARNPKCHSCPFSPKCPSKR